MSAIFVIFTSCVHVHLTFSGFLLPPKILYVGNSRSLMQATKQQPNAALDSQTISDRMISTDIEWSVEIHSSNDDRSGSSTH